MEPEYPYVEQNCSSHVDSAPVDRLNDRFEARFNRIDEIKPIRDDIKAILLRLPNSSQTG